MKYTWYQADAYVIVTIFQRNIKNEDITITFSDTNLTVSLKLSDSQNTKELKLTLAQAIVPDKSSYKVCATKVEIKLIKVQERKWYTLTEDAVTGKWKNIPKDDSSATSSANPFRKDWKAIEPELERELAEEILTGEHETTNKIEVLQKTYEEGTDEVKKAMNKSYVESCGTIVCTLWDEVSKDKVPITLRDGMEWKKWQ